MSTVRLTAAQTLVRFLTEQYVERDGEERRIFTGCFGIFGPGNVAGVGTGAPAVRRRLYLLSARNEQAMVHAAAFARQKNRLQTMACTSSIGPGATNMVTGRPWRR
jgi:3D-(3,5/4)-trihydroxycyclohexane-1,2-dione acylhydrolase (decyclizing)